MMYERPLQRWENGDYRQIPNKEATGSPTCFLLTKGVDQVTMTLWPVPQQETTIAFTYARVPDDVTDGAQTIDIPQAWMETVYYNLASRLCRPFGVTRTDPAAAADVTARAEALLSQMLDMDRPASLFMGPYYGDYRG